MLIVPSVSALASHVGRELAPTAWHEITEAAIQAFAQATGDLHWIHTDAERARRETPFGGLLAHGFLTLSAITAWSGECVRIERAKTILNYGLDRVRFTAPVIAGMRLRLRMTLAELSPSERGSTRLKWTTIVDIEGKPRPALAADWLWMVVEEETA